MSVFLSDNDGRPSPRTRALRAAVVPFGTTVPPVFFCGHCRAVRVPENRTLCLNCRRLLREQEIHQKEVEQLRRRLFWTGVTCLAGLAALFVWLACQ